MSDEPTGAAADVIGGNVSADLQNRVEQYAEKLDAIDKLKVEADAIKKDAKAEGYDMKVFAQVVKESRKGFGYLAKQLELELNLGAYRKGVGLPTDLKKAQELAAKEAALEPESKSEKSDKKRRTKMN